MKANRVVLSVLCATAVVGLTIWLAAEHQARLRLGEENKALRQQLDQMAGLVAENERLSNLVAQAKSSQSLPDDRLKELLRLRGEAGVLRQQTKELETLRNENRQARTALENGLNADYWPRDSWAFAGYASPDAALQSFLWAASKGDLKTLLGSITGEMQKELEKDLEGKSESEVSAKGMADTARLNSVSVLNSEAQGDDTVVLSVAFEEGTNTNGIDMKGTNTNGIDMIMKKIGNEWKLSGIDLHLFK
jgi:hypothetical protein